MTARRRRRRCRSAAGWRSRWSAVLVIPVVRHRRAVAVHAWAPAPRRPTGRGRARCGGGRRRRWGDPAWQTATGATLATRRHRLRPGRRTVASSTAAPPTPGRATDARTLTPARLTRSRDVDRRWTGTDRLPHGRLIYGPPRGRRSPGSPARGLIGMLAADPAAASPGSSAAPSSARWRRPVRPRARSPRAISTSPALIARARGGGGQRRVRGDERRLCAPRSHSRRRWSRSAASSSAPIVHDLRTPLFSLRGYLEGLEKGLADTPEKQARYIAVAAGESGGAGTADRRPLRLHPPGIPGPDAAAANRSTSARCSPTRRRRCSRRRRPRAC